MLVAKQIASPILNNKISGWKVGNLVNYGKSALVCKAYKTPHETRAIKIFDPEIISHFGEKTQMARLERQLSLIGKRHKHLIEILDGG